MSQELKLSAERVADRYNRYETALDQAMIEAARALEAQLTARQVARLNIRIGQSAVEGFLESTTHLSQAMRAVIRSHRVLEQLAPTLGIQIAGGGKTAPPDPGNGYDSDGRYPLPPAAAAETITTARH